MAWEPTSRIRTGEKLHRHIRRTRSSASRTPSWSGWQSSSYLHHEVLRGGVVHDNGRGALLRIKQEPGGQMHTDVFVRMQQREQLRLVFQIGARRVSKRVARSAILLMEQIANVRRVVARDSQLLANLLVRQLGQRFG